MGLIFIQQLVYPKCSTSTFPPFTVICVLKYKYFFTTRQREGGREGGRETGKGGREIGREGGKEGGREGRERRGEGREGRKRGEGEVLD